MPLTKDQMNLIATRFIHQATSHHFATAKSIRKNVVTLVGNNDTRLRVQINEESGTCGLYAYGATHADRPYQPYLEQA